MSNPLSRSGVCVALLAILAAGEAVAAPASAPAPVSASAPAAASATAPASEAVEAAVPAEVPAPATLPAQDMDDLRLPPLLLQILAVGVIVLAGLLFIRLSRPRKLFLRDTPGRPNHLTILHVAAPLLGYLLVMVVASGLLQTATGASARDRRLGGLMAAAAAQVAWVAISLLIAARTFRGGIVHGLGLSLRRWLVDVLRSAISYFAVIPVCIGMLVISVYLLPRGMSHKHDLLQLMHEVSPAWQRLIWLSAVVLAPLAEEIYFRGIMQSFIRRQTGKPWAAVLLASGFFAAIHLNQPQAVASLFALSVVLGYNYERTGRLLPSILIHVVFNAVFMLAEMG